MSDQQEWKPEKAAIRLSKIAAAFSQAHGVDRFPVTIQPLALDAAHIFGWQDPIIEIRAVDIKGFDGALFSDDNRTKWMLLYNDKITSPGRIRFTQAHELGHYILHRLSRESFQCSSDDILSWDEQNIEAEADLFASFLLMPLDDYRAQISSTIDLNLLKYCADRYGVSLTAAALKWIQFTEENAVLILSRDGFIKWAYSSRSAARAGAFFRSRTQTIPIPLSSIAASTAIQKEYKGLEVPARVWFEYAESSTTLREMKSYSEQYDYTMTLLILPRSASVWKPFNT